MTGDVVFVCACDCVASCCACGVVRVVLCLCCVGVRVERVFVWELVMCRFCIRAV